MLQKKVIYLVSLCLLFNVVIAQDVKHGTLITEKLNSKVLLENRIGLDPNRTIKVFLPPGYAQSTKSFPVVYFLHNFYWSAEKAFEDGNLIKLLERGFNEEIVREFIFVSADFSSPTTGSLYENSPVSGKWLDYIVGEIVPFIDTKFRSIRNRESRALVGDFFGGRGTLKLAMTHADLFSVAYAMHPVATGTGYTPLPTIQIDWKKIQESKIVSEIEDGRTRLFLSICQAFLPNLNRPPYYCDYFMEKDKVEFKVHVENTRSGYFNQFLLLDSLDECAENLKSMRGLAFDWARFDPNQSHVYSNQEFSRKLEDLGIDHEAEEYRGDPWSQTWTNPGRFYSRVLPFLNRHLIFESPK